MGNEKVLAFLDEIASGKRPDGIITDLGDVGDSSADFAKVQIKGENWLPPPDGSRHEKLTDYLAPADAKMTISVLSYTGNNLHGSSRFKHSIIDSCKDLYQFDLTTKCA